tara:strand:- start:32 stop:1318 length:1287 start_codon:yes stop_codon:yes gene_type:complete
MIHVPELKEPQQGLVSQKYLKPKKLYLPLSQHIGKPSSLSVERQAIVEESELIAKADGFISSNLHAPKKGKVINIDTYNHPTLKRSTAVILQCEDEEKEYTRIKSIETFSKDDLLEKVKAAGIVGMGGASFPTQVKLNPPKKIDTFIINACECEPYLATDNRLMVENLEELMLGVEIVAKIIEPTQIIFAIENNKSEAIKKINLFINTKKSTLPETKLVVLKSAYPQGGEKQLIYNTITRKVPAGKLPLDVGCLVHNVATCFAIYEAIYLNKPLIERLVGFYGDALKEPKNIWLKIGTTLKELFDEKILELKADPVKIISGGPMMGINITSLDYPIMKASGGFLFLASESNTLEESVCIKCARCVDACPMDLQPLEFAKFAKKENFSLLNDFYISDCIECGCCSYVCPAKIPLVHYIKIGKQYAPKNK